MENGSSQERAFLLIGSFFLIIGVIFNEWVLASLFSADGSIIFSNRVIIWVVDLIMVTTGAMFIIKRKTLRFRMLFNCLIMTLLMIIFIEVVLNIAYAVINPGYEEKLKDKSYLLPSYKDKEWAKDIFKERSDIRISYKAFRMWGAEEYHGEYIDLDSQGYRKTWNPESDSGEKPKTIYMVGPSVVWGLGARDDYTIPSYMSKKLNAKGYNFEVKNYGVFAYSNLQGIVNLILLLRDGHRPDYVIFADGVGDVYFSYQGGVAGELTNTFLISERLKKTELTNTEHILSIIRNLLNKYSVIYKELVKIERIINVSKSPKESFQEIAHSFSDDELRKLGKDTVDFYMKSLKLLDNLSKIYGFKYLCFWHPGTFYEDKLTEDELEIFDIQTRFKDDALRKLFNYTHNYLKEQSIPHFYDITDAISGRKTAYYWDWLHYTEEGNEAIADKMVSIFKKEFILNE